MFQFSPRPGTPAAEMDDQIDPVVVSERFARLTALQDSITYERNREQVGTRVSVMVEGPSKKDPLVATTRTRGNRIVHVLGVWEPGSFMTVDVTEAAAHFLMGAVVEELVS
jgi:tRNA-2-methylthio-N6-dimethylallyladenosine synthase